MSGKTPNLLVILVLMDEKKDFLLIPNLIILKNWMEISDRTEQP